MLEGIRRWKCYTCNYILGERARNREKRHYTKTNATGTSTWSSCSSTKAAMSRQLILTDGRRCTGPLRTSTSISSNYSSVARYIQVINILYIFITLIKRGLGELVFIYHNEYVNVSP